MSSRGQLALVDQARLYLRPSRPMPPSPMFVRSGPERSQHRFSPGEQWPPLSLGNELIRKFKAQHIIQEIGSLPRGWDGYSAEPPSQTAIAKALGALELLYRLNSLPLRVVALTDGGLALVMMARPFYAAVEFYNDGEAVVAFSDRKERQLAWEVSTNESQLKASIERLLELMHG